MVSTDTAVHVAVLTVAVASLFVLDAVFAGSTGAVPQAATFLVLNGLVLAGAHFLLAVLGRDGLVPVDARWRFVGAVAVLLALGTVGILTDPVSLGPVTTDELLAALGVLTMLGYLVSEARAGYRESVEGTA
ncbi:MAG: hypothetical protein ABEJ40_03985 [Haloarculaceae archaeon]